MSAFFTSKFHTGDPCLPLESGNEVVIFIGDSKALMGSKFKIRKAVIAGPLLVADKKTGSVKVLMAVNVESAKSPGKTYMDMIHPMQVVGIYTEELYEQIKTISSQSKTPDDFIGLVMTGKGAGEVIFDKTAMAAESPVVPQKAEGIPSLLEEAPVEAVPAVPTKPTTEFSINDLDLSIFGTKTTLLN